MVLTFLELIGLDYMIQCLRMRVIMLLPICEVEETRAETGGAEHVRRIKLWLWSSGVGGCCITIMLLFL